MDSDGGFRQILGQSLMVAGGAVGAGLLALPVVTYQAGLQASIIGLVFVWMYMFASATLLIESASAMKSRTPNLLSMAGTTLGLWGSRLCFILYILVYSATMSAYVAEGGRQTAELALSLSSSSSPGTNYEIAIAMIHFAAISGYAIYRGPKDVEKLNGIAMIGAILSFGFLVHSAVSGEDGKTGDSISASNTFRILQIEGSGGERTNLSNGNWSGNWSALPRAFPVFVVAFSYHNVVPSVFASVQRNTKLCTLSIALGSAVSCVMYVLWLTVTLKPSITSTLSEPPSREIIFEQLRRNAGLALPLFCFFAIVTSTLGVGLGTVDFLVDFFEDGIQNQSKKQNLRVQATLLTFVPSLFISICFPKAFVPLLEFSGVFRLALFGAMPVIMVWRIRNHPSQHGDTVEYSKLSCNEEEYVDLNQIPVHTEVLPGGNIGLAVVGALTMIMAFLQLKLMFDKFMGR